MTLDEIIEKHTDGMVRLVDVRAVRAANSWLHCRHMIVNGIMCNDHFQSGIDERIAKEHQKMLDYWLNEIGSNAAGVLLRYIGRVGEDLDFDPRNRRTLSIRNDVIGIDLFQELASL